MTTSEQRVLRYLKATKATKATAACIASDLGMRQDVVSQILRRLKEQCLVQRGGTTYTYDRCGRRRPPSVVWEFSPDGPALPIHVAALASRPALQVVWQGART